LKIEEKISVNTNRLKKDESLLPALSPREIPKTEELGLPIIQPGKLQMISPIEARNLDGLGFLNVSFLI
jgi:hypothetical protein